MKNELKVLKPRVMKVVFVVFILIFGVVAWSHAQEVGSTFRSYDKQDSTRNSESIDVYADSEDGELVLVLKIDYPYFEDNDEVGVKVSNLTHELEWLFTATDDVESHHILYFSKKAQRKIKKHGLDHVRINEHIFEMTPEGAKELYIEANTLASN